MGTDLAPFFYLEILCKKGKENLRVAMAHQLTGGAIEVRIMLRFVVYPETLYIMPLAFLSERRLNDVKATMVISQD